MKNKKNFQHDGFTLIEIMIVLTIMGALVAIAIPKMSSTNRDIKSVLRRISILSKELHVQARIQNATYRMVIDMGEEDLEKNQKKHQIWVEKSTRKGQFFYIDDDGQKQDDTNDEDTDSAQNDGFEKDLSILKNPIQLIRGMSIKDIELGAAEDTIEDGKAYIHYLAEGLVEEAAIHLEYLDEKKWTVVIHPLTGKADIASEYISLKDLRDQ